MSELQEEVQDCTRTHQPEGIQMEHADFVSLMEEPPGGPNRGYMDGVALDAERAEAHQLLAGSSLTQVYRSDIGARAHRGVVHPDEYVDRDVLVRMVEDEFGFTKAEVDSVYTVKRLRKDQRQLRDAIDARLLALRASGANMVAFATAIGLNPRTMERALARARRTA